MGKVDKWFMDKLDGESLILKDHIYGLELKYEKEKKAWIQEKKVLEEKIRNLKDLLLKVSN